jgi:hypothetical protein
MSLRHCAGNRAECHPGTRPIMLAKDTGRANDGPFAPVRPTAGPYRTFFQARDTWPNAP